jgi:hypothetical protein
MLVMAMIRDAPAASRAAGEQCQALRDARGRIPLRWVKEFFPLGQAVK